MLTRRIVAASTCALALAVPALAGAQPADNQPVAYGGPSVAKSGGVGYGDTKYDLQNKDLGAAKADTANVYVPPADPTKVYVSTTPKAAPGSSPVASDDTNGWQIAALGEAGLLVAIGLGSVALLRARRRVVAQ